MSIRSNGQINLVAFCTMYGAIDGSCANSSVYSTCTVFQVAGSQSATGHSDAVLGAGERVAMSNGSCTIR
ncbi:MAG: hypothetical protein ABIN67_19730 [Ferruginibacter sp.]